MQLRWWQRGPIYQIYPRSFSDSNGDGVGDLRGITQRLDYLARGDHGLGVEAIWLSPFYPSPMADFGYDVADYTNVDPLFGTMADFDRLVEEAHGRDIRVLVDWVPNHTSNQHPWFLESRSGRSSPKRDWYVWRDPGPDGGPPNNWRSAFKAVGPSWTLDESTGQYYLHSFTPEQPDLNWDNPDVEAAMHDVLRFWLDRGIDGFRIDVVQKLAKDPALGDNEPNLRHDEDWPTIHERLRRIRDVVDSYDDRMLVGEVYLFDLQRLVSYIESGDQLDLAHNFVFVHLPWDAQAIRQSVEQFEDLARRTAWPAWFLANHDHPRVASRFADDLPGSGARRARLAALLISTLRGTPFIYQGEELGLPDAEIPPESVVDVDGRDPERAPIPWSPPSKAGPGAGFTSGQPWLPLPGDAEHLSVSSQLADPDSTLHFVRRLIALRAREPALQGGRQRSLDVDAAVFCFMRELDDRRFLVALNFTSREVRLRPREVLPAPATLELSTSAKRELGDVDPGTLVLKPDEGVVCELARLSTV
jgi:alpha-glucosidase